MDVETKKINMEHSLPEEQILVPSITINVHTKFVNASELITPMPEISDQELLKMALEFERKYGN